MGFKGACANILQGNNNDLNLALNELFDNPDSTKVRLDEMFSISERKI